MSAGPWGEGGVAPDYLVVGAGSAGCVVAERLSACGKHRVLVVEAGRPNRWNPWLRLPLGFGKTFADPTVNWCLTTQVDSGTGRTHFWPRGKGWGGSSAINGLVWIHPFPSDIERWRPAAGFGWAEFAPHLRALRDQHGGGVPVESPAPRFDADDLALHGAFFQAANGLQVPRLPSLDFHNDAPPTPGTGYYATNTANGLRVGARASHLRPALRRRNCRILSGFDAWTLVFDDSATPDAGRVVGVRDARGQVLRARRGVILTAGAVGSPLLLLRSGLKARLPHVGENLSDHLGINYSFRATIPTTNRRLATWPARALSALRYAMQRRGPLAFGINPAGGFFKTNPSLAQPDFQLYLQSLTTTAVGVGYQRAQTGERPILAPDNFDAFSLGLSHCQPASVGTIALNADGSPRIQPNSFADPGDMLAFIDAVKFLRRLAHTPPLARIIDAEIAPGPNVQGDAALGRDIRARCGSVYHPVSTCRMARAVADGVVDPTGAVHGLAGLQIMDASVFPSQISTNTNATVMALAHKLAQAEALKPT